MKLLSDEVIAALQSQESELRSRVLSERTRLDYPAIRLTSRTEHLRLTLVEQRRADYAVDARRLDTLRRGLAVARRDKSGFGILQSSQAHVTAAISVGSTSQATIESGVAQLVGSVTRVIQGSVALHSGAASIIVHIDAGGTAHFNSGAAALAGAGVVIHHAGVALVPAAAHTVGAGQIVHQLRHADSSQDGKLHSSPAGLRFSKMSKVHQSSAAPASGHAVLHGAGTVG